MNNSKLKIGDKVEIEINDEFYDLEQPLVSQYEIQLPDGTMEILSPIHKGRLFYIARNTKIDVIYEHKGDLFKFGAIVLGNRFSGRIALLRIQPVTEEKRIQRRRFFRLNCVLDIEYRIFEKEDMPVEERGDFKKSITKDISGGGICFLLNEKPRHGWLMEGKLKISDQEVKFDGRVLRIVPTNSEKGYKYEIGLEFIKISNRHREKLISFIFDYQRKLLKKGWYIK
ncbi:MAG: hypothetical protein GX957_07065 [Clostridiaceae bacterium]|nr:hypothetical protein [Clostridiaceae bacterium]